MLPRCCLHQHAHASPVFGTPDVGRKVTFAKSRAPSAAASEGAEEIVLSNLNNLNKRKYRPLWAKGEGVVQGESFVVQAVEPSVGGEVVLQAEGKQSGGTQALSTSILNPAQRREPREERLFKQALEKIYLCCGSSWVPTRAPLGHALGLPLRPPCHDGLTWPQLAEGRTWFDSRASKMPTRV